MPEGKHRKNGVPPEEVAAKHEAIQTDREATKALIEARKRTSEVRRIAGALRRIRERNHFGEMVRSALDGM